jgi:predicted nucleotide-binding protein
MAAKFKGTVEELRALMESASLDGEWSDDGKGRHTFRSREGGILNFWPSTGNVQLQGQASAKEALSSVISHYDVSTTLKPTTDFSGKRRGLQRIFIVHGHDTEACDQMELALRRLGLEPFILMNTSGGGKTLIEALEGQIGRDYSDDTGRYWLC